MHELSDILDGNHGSHYSGMLGILLKLWERSLGLENMWGIIVDGDKIELVQNEEE